MKHVHRLTPVSAFDVPGIESWLQDMSARGLRLIRFRPLFCTFERCEPEDRRYRVEACPHIFSGEVPASMKELYEEFGWEYTDAVGGGLQIFTTTDPNAPEPTSDPRTQADVWVKVRRGRTINCLAPLLVALLDMGILLWTDAQGIFLQYVLLKEGALILFMSAFLLTGPNRAAASGRDSSEPSDSMAQTQYTLCCVIHLRCGVTHSCCRIPYDTSRNQCEGPAASAIPHQLPPPYFGGTGRKASTG